MNEKPVPPVFAPEPDQPQGAPAQGEGRSAYGGMSAQETVDAYLGRPRSIKAQSIALVIANAVAMVWFIERGHVALYFFGFVLLFAIVLIARARMASLFVKLSEVVSQDCDPARYRAVLDVLSARDRFGRSANAIAIELAYCDYLELDSAGALSRLGSASFKRPDNPRWFRVMQVEFLSRVDTGDLDGARDTLSRLSAFRTSFKEGSRNRAVIDSQIADFTVLVRPPAERDAADAARMRERMAAADYHQQRANWQLYLAEYELLHGSPEEASRLASDASLEPLTPRMERLRAEVLSGLKVGA